MKVFKKIFISFLLLCIIFNIGVWAEDEVIYSFGETENLFYSQSAKMLEDIGIFETSKDEEIPLDKTVTRAEICTIIIKMLGLDSLKNLNDITSSFTDVDSSNPAIYDINMIANLGISNGVGEGRFGPDEQVTNLQAIVMLVKVLGYEAIASEKGGYPTGYISVAAQRGVSTNFKAQLDASATRGDIAALVVNTLNADYLMQTNFGLNEQFSISSDKTILSDRLKIFKIDGIVSATHLTKLLIPISNINVGEVIIDGEKYYVGDTNVSEFLGYNVRMYYRYNEQADSKTIVHIRKNDNKNEVVSIKASDKIEYNNYKYTVQYDENDKTESYNLSKNVSVIYNGRTYNSFSAFDIIPALGWITLLDNNSDGVFDVVFVNSYTNYRVNSINTEDMRIIDTQSEAFSSSDTVPITLDIDESSPDVYINIFRDGQKVESSDISQNDIISVFVSNDSKVYTIFISSNTVNGKISSIDEEFYYIDDVGYKISSNVKMEININDEGTFYLDYEGNIAGADISKERKFAFLTGIDGGKGLEPITKLELLMSDNSTEILDCSDKVTVNGISIKTSSGGIIHNKSIWDYDKTEYSNAKPIAYEVNKDNKITLIDTPVIDNPVDYALLTAEEKAANDAELALANKDNNLALKYKTAYRYYKPQSPMFVYGDGDYTALGKEVLYTTPNSVYYDWLRNGSTKDDIVASSLKKFTENLQYTVKGYCTDSDLVDIVVQVLESAEDDTILKKNKEPLFVVKSVNAAINDKGDSVNKVYGIRNSDTGYSINVNTDSDRANTVASTLKFGDAIIAEENMRGDIQNMYKAFDVTTKTDNISLTPMNNSRTCFGKIVNIKNNIIYVSKTVGGIDVIYKYALIGTKVYKCDMNAKILTLSKVSNLQIGQSVLIRVMQEYVNEAVIYVGNGF